MPRNSFLLILPILSGTACVYHYGEGTAPHDTASSSTGPGPDEPDTDPPDHSADPPVPRLCGDIEST